MKRKALQYSVLAILISTSAILSYSQLNNGHGWGGDFSSYIMQAESLLSGTIDNFIKHNTFTITQSDIDFAPIAYPWGYPLLITPVIHFLGINFLGIKILGILFYVLFLVALFFLFEKHLPILDNLVLLAIFSLNPLLLSFPNYILADIPFLFFSTLSILLVDRFSNRTGLSSQHLLERFTIGAVLFFAFFIRTSGLILLLSFFVYEFFKKPRKITFFRVVPYLSFILLFAISLLFLPNGEKSHLLFYKDISRITIGQNIKYYAVLGSSFFSHTPNALAIYYLVSLFFFVGIVKKYREKFLFIIYFIFTLTLYVFWPFQQGIRFLFPILPIFIYFAIEGTKAVFSYFPLPKTGWGRVIHSGFWLLIIYSFATTSIPSAKVFFDRKQNSKGPYDETSSEMFQYITQNISPDSIIAFYKPRVMRFRTGRDALIIKKCEHIERADYIVRNTEEGDGEQLKDKEVKRCDIPLNEIYNDGRFIIYEISKNE